MGPKTGTRPPSCNTPREPTIQEIFGRFGFMVIFGLAVLNIQPSGFYSFGLPV